MTVSEFLKLRPGVDRVRLGVSGGELDVLRKRVESSESVYGFWLRVRPIGDPASKTHDTCRIHAYDVIWGEEPESESEAEAPPGFTLEIYNKDNPIQEKDILDVAGMEMTVVSVDHDHGVVFLEKPPCPDTGEFLWITSVKQGRRPIKKEPVSGVKVCEIRYDAFWCYKVDGVNKELANILEDGKKYALIELEERE